MKIKELTEYGPKNKNAKLRNKNGSKHYNIKHGIFALGFWEYTMGVSDLIPENFEEPELPLTGDYNLVPLLEKDKRTIREDRKSNGLYYIIESNEDEVKNDVLIFWTLPTVKYKDIDYRIKGEFKLLGKGINVNDLKNQVEAPIVLITGTTILTWSGIDDAGVEWYQRTTVTKGEIKTYPVEETRK